MTSYRLLGIQNEKEEFELVYKDENHKKIGTLIGKLEETSSLEGILKKEDGSKIEFEWEMEKSLPISCVEYADFSSAFTAVYPALYEHPIFNDYIFDQVKNWLAQSREQTVKTLVENGKSHPDYRFSVQAHAWFELAHFSDKIISGYLVGNTTWKGDYLQSFNFDLENNENIGIEDLFDLSLDFNAFIHEVIGDHLKQRPFYNEPDFQAWLFRQSFEEITIKEDGIEFCSGYNPVYGTQKLTIKYETLKPYLKGGNPLEHLYAVR